MTTRDQAIIGVVAIAVLLVVYVIALSRALARKPPLVSDQTPSFAAVEQEVIPILTSLELNGQLPVATIPEELGKDNPFAR